MLHHCNPEVEHSADFDICAATRLYDALGACSSLKCDAPAQCHSPFALQIVSLHAMGGPLQECCAASYGNMLYVYPLTAPPGRAWAPKASWQAHRGAVTALHRSSFGVQLVSGATDGSIHLCVHL